MKIGFFEVVGSVRFRWQGVVMMALVLLLSDADVFGQRYRNQFVPYSTVGAGLGTSSYYGDMASYRRVIASTFKMARWNLSGEYTRHFSPRFAGRASLTWARIAGDDYQMNKSGRLAMQNLFLRNLHFRNDIAELSAVGIFKLTPDGRSYDRRPQFGAYLFGGVALFAHNPKARLPIPDGSTERQRWVALRNLGTEGQGRVGYDKLYSLVGFAIPIGFGVRYKITSQFDVGAEIGFRFTNSDYLDDVATAAPDPAIFAGDSDPLAAQMSFRALERRPARFPDKNRADVLQTYPGYEVDPFATLEAERATVIRGGSAHRNDAYMTGTIKLVYVLGPTVKCPPLK